METKIINKKKEWRKFLKVASDKFAIIIYKFSPRCALNNYTDMAIDNWCKSTDVNNDLVLLNVDVTTSKSLSAMIEKELKIQHKSQQIIWLDKEMKVKFSGSHYEITEDELTNYL